MGIIYYSDQKYRVLSFLHGDLVLAKFFDTKDQAIEYFNHCCGLSNENYFYEIWHENSLLFTTEE